MAEPAPQATETAAPDTLPPLVPGDMMRSAVTRYEAKAQQMLAAKAAQAEAAPEPVEEANPVETSAAETEETEPLEADTSETEEPETESKEAPEGFEEVDSSAMDDEFLLTVNGEERTVTTQQLLREYQRKSGSDAEVQQKLDKAAQAEAAANSREEHAKAKLVELEQYETDTTKAAEDYLSNAAYWTRLVEQAHANDAEYTRMSDDQLRQMGLNPHEYRSQAVARADAYSRIQQEVADAQAYVQRKRDRERLGGIRAMETRLRTTWGNHYDERLKIVIGEAKKHGFTDEDMKAGGIHPVFAEWAWKAYLHDRAHETEPARKANGKGKGEPGSAEVLPPKVLRRKRTKPVSTTRAGSSRNDLANALQAADPRKAVSQMMMKRARTRTQ